MRRVLGVFTAIVLAAGAWLVAAAPPAFAAPNGFTVDTKTGTLYSVDLATGDATKIGPTGQGDIEGLALACDGTLFGINRENGEPNQLVTINTSTGAATVVGPLSQEPSDAGLTFGADGRLFMAQVNVPHDFFEINRNTAAVTDIGPLGDDVEPTGLGTRADGTFFGFDRKNDNLVTINTTTGAATTVGGSGLGLNLIGLDFDTSGTLWGIHEDGKIVTFNTSTGAATQVATYSTDFEFVSLAIAPVGCEQPAPPSPPAPAAAPVVEGPSFTG